LKEKIAAAPDSLIPPSVKKRLKIKVLFLINDDIMTPEGTEFKRLNQVTATLRAVASSSIQGRNTWWVEYFHKNLPAPEHPETFILQGPDTPERDQVPLGRWLSLRSVDSVCARVGRIEAMRALR
jgi:hypothetical protein